MTKYITIKLTEDQFHHIIRGLGYTMEDYSDSYPEYPTLDDKRVQKTNAFVQRFIDKLIKQYKQQNS